MFTNARRRPGCLIAGFLALLAFSFAASVYISMLSVPKGSPLHAMRVTEANLTLLQTAIEAYRNDFGQYPDAGAEGLNRAVAHMSRVGNYLPGGPPLDAWGDPYVYVPHSAYATQDAGAIRGGDGKYYAPETYQLYSIGLDRDAGFFLIEAQQDNINSWDTHRSWRPHYNHKHKEFLTRWRKLTPEERVQNPQ